MICPYSPQSAEEARSAAADPTGRSARAGSRVPRCGGGHSGATSPPGVFPCAFHVPSLIHPDRRDRRPCTVARPRIRRFRQCIRPFRDADSLEISQVRLRFFLGFQHHGDGFCPLSFPPRREGFPTPETPRPWWPPRSSRGQALHGGGKSGRNAHPVGGTREFQAGQGTRLEPRAYGLVSGRRVPCLRPCIDMPAPASAWHAGWNAPTDQLLKPSRPCSVPSSGIVLPAGLAVVRLACGWAILCSTSSDLPKVFCGLALAFSVGWSWCSAFTG